jgi:single-strand DNA-binding protein
MSSSLNKVFLIGRIGQEPEIKTTSLGHVVVNFSLATDESYTGQDGHRVERTEWHRVVAWDKQAEFVANYLSKGALIYLEGRLETRKWQDQQGITRYVTEIRAIRVTGLGNTMSNDQLIEQQSQSDNCNSTTKESTINISFPLQSCDMDNIPF